MLQSAIPWEFGDKHKTLITSHNRIQVLAQNGYYFEACAAQATVMEAMLFLFMLGVVLNKPREEYEKVARGISKLTLGGLINRAEKLSLLDSGLLLKLREYKEGRNFLVHHHLVESHDFDYQSLLAGGQAILASLFRPLRRQVYERMKAIGHKDADKFRDDV